MRAAAGSRASDCNRPSRPSSRGAAWPAPTGTTCGPTWRTRCSCPRETIGSRWTRPARSSEASPGTRRSTSTAGDDARHPRRLPCSSTARSRAITTSCRPRCTAATSRGRCDVWCGELPSSERRALTATATGAGFAGSGLGRSSHYRALDRARLRLTATVRSRIAGGLALPAVLLRRLGSGRGILAPVSVAVAAGIASVALVLPATELSAPAYARATLAAGAIQHAASVAAHASTPPPPHLTHRRVRIRAAAPAAPHRSAPRQVTRPIATRAPSPTPPAGLGPCRAARLCQ